MKQHRSVALEIALVSFVILFQELALIRWLPSQVRVVAYFPNIVLMGAFLGLGVGCLRVRRELPSWLWPASMLLLTVASFGMSRVAFTQESTSEHLWLLYFDLVDPLVVDDVRLPILTLFALTASSFVSLGHYLARRIERMTQLDATLTGYGLDLLGSLCGIVVFSLASFLSTGPGIWFGLLAASVMWLLRGESKRLVVFVALAGVVVVALVWHSSREATFSPYYEITTGRLERLSGTVVMTNGSLHQYAAPVASHRNYPGLTEEDKTIQDGYRAPYKLLRQPPRRVLVLGAGTGNDVAAALAAGAAEVDAVEIDPEIVALGRRIHPNRPYHDPRVRVVKDDARSFLQKTQRRYDLVVFGTLDSMTRLSALSSVRLDNFIYTREALDSARRVLAPGGGVVMYFMVGPGYIGERLTALHHDAFGQTPAAIRNYSLLFNLVLMSGEAFDHLARVEDTADPLPPVIVPTDDWPFLYLAGREISPFYVQMILAIAIMAIVAILGSSEDMRRAAMRGRVDLEMLGLGAAFLLLETRSVTQMNLAWGATWVTSAVVFGSILVTLLAATLLMDRRPISPSMSTIGLSAALLVAFITPVSLLSGNSVPVKLLLSILVVGSPLFFASTLFAVRFKARRHTGIALGWNLLGAVLGGLLEFTSMVVGIRALTLIALGIYLGAVAAGNRFVEEPSSTIPSS